MKSTFWCVHCYPPYCYFHFYPSFHCLQRCSPCCCFHSFPTCCCYFHCHWPWCCFHCFQPCCCCFHFLLSLLWLTTTHLSCYLVPCLSDRYFPHHNVPCMRCVCIQKVATRWCCRMACFEHLLGPGRSATIFKCGKSTEQSDITEPVKCV